MTIYWEEASKLVLSMAEEVINNYHDRLLDLNILFMFRSEPAVSNGRITYAKCQKVSPQMRTLLNNADFIIWISKDDWDKNPDKWRMALLDHELTHCGVYEDDKLYIRPHDIEEFNDIIERHGVWTRDILKTKETFKRMEQKALPGIESIELSSRGKVVTMTPEQFDRAVTELTK